MVRCRLLAALLFGTLAAGCTIPPAVTTSLGEPGLAADPALAGAWIGTPDEGPAEVLVTLSITPREDSTLIDVVAVACCEPPPGPDWIRFVAYAVELDGHRLYDLTLAEAGPTVVGGDGTPFAELLPEGEHVPVRVELAGDGRLELYFLSENALARLAADGRVSARDVMPDEYDSHWRIEATHDELIALIRAFGFERLFAERWGPFVRPVGVPSIAREDPAWAD